MSLLFMALVGGIRVASRNYWNHQDLIMHEEIMVMDIGPYHGVRCVKKWWNYHDHGWGLIMG
jgi:hypothetical protein